MSGHSKWATIKHKKGALDAKRGKIFSKITKEITVAARLGGGDPAFNPRLRTVLLAAKAANMPNDNIDRAVKKGTGELPGQSYEEIRYECYAPGGVALIVDVLTDNKNRTVAEVRHLLGRHNGSMAEANAVAWNFETKGLIAVSKEGLSEEAVFEKAVEAGADDVDTDGDMYELLTAPGDLHAVVNALGEQGISAQEAKLTMHPKTTVAVDSKTISSILKLMEALEDHDDVQNVYSNLEITDEAMAAAMAE